MDDRVLTNERDGFKLRGNFVHTMPARGLTQGKADSCIAILNREDIAQAPEEHAGFNSSSFSVASTRDPLKAKQKSPRMAQHLPASTTLPVVKQRVLPPLNLRV